MTEFSRIRSSRKEKRLFAGLIAFWLVALALAASTASAFSTLSPVASFDERSTARLGERLSIATEFRSIDLMQIDRISPMRGMAPGADSERLYTAADISFLSGRARFDHGADWQVGMESGELEITEKGKPDLGDFARPVPEPMSLLLLGGGLIGLATIRRVGYRG